MKKDPTLFRERFNRWKSGQKVYEAGKPIESYEEGKPDEINGGDLLFHNGGEVMVTPNGVGLNYDNPVAKLMIPVGAQYTDAQRHEMEGERGAMAVRRATNKAVPYLLPLVAAPATAVLAPALTSAGEAYSAWSAANPFLSATLNAGIESAFIGDVANRRLIQGEHPTYGQGGDILDKYVLPASLDLMDVTIGLGALSKTPTIIRNAGPVLREGAEAATDAFNYVDRGFTPKSADLDINKPNTLTRLVGTGDSGYKDALTSGVIRGNPKPAIGQAREVNKNQRAMRKRGVAEEDIRAYASNNILGKDLYYRIKAALDDIYGLWQAVELGDLGAKKYAGDLFRGSYEEFLNLLAINLKLFDAQLLFPRMGNHGPEWADNWKGNSMATFGTPGEDIAKIGYVGDYGLLVANADKYAVDASYFGHLHPTTEYPLAFDNPDVTWYKRCKGWLTRRPYMKELSKEQVLEDAVRYNNVAHN